MTYVGDIIIILFKHAHTVSVIPITKGACSHHINISSGIDRHEQYATYEVHLALSLC